MAEASEHHYVIVGLGNPGKKYALTRHNIGYLVVQALAAAKGWQFKEEPQFSAQVAKGRVDGKTVHLLLPLTYMNESGQAVRRYLDFYKLGPQQLRVVCDDIALPFGELRVRAAGSSGGHNGLKSIQAHLHTTYYVRLRMGIGCEVQNTLADYVLDNFSADELQHIAAFIERGCHTITRLINEDVSVVMNAVNGRKNTLKNPKMASNEGQENKI